MPEKWVENPRTGRPILEGGPTHRTLRASGVHSFSAAPAPHHGRYYAVPHATTLKGVSARRASVRSLASELAGARKREKTRPRRRYLTKTLSRLRKNVGQGRGSALRGWSAVKPITQEERRAVYNKCGAKCFLAAPIKTKTGRMVLKFPICGIHSCTPDPRGILAAQVRAKGRATRFRRSGQPATAAAYAKIGQHAASLRTGGQEDDLDLDDEDGMIMMGGAAHKTKRRRRTHSPSRSRSRSKSRSRSGRSPARSKSRSRSGRHGNVWTDAVQAARAELGIRGFVALRRDSALYKRAMQIKESRMGGSTANTRPYQRRTGSPQSLARRGASYALILATLQTEAPYWSRSAAVKWIDDSEAFGDLTPNSAQQLRLIAAQTRFQGE